MAAYHRLRFTAVYKDKKGDVVYIRGGEEKIFFSKLTEADMSDNVDKVVQQIKAKAKKPRLDVEVEFTANEVVSE